MDVVNDCCCTAFKRNFLLRELLVFFCQSLAEKTPPKVSENPVITRIAAVAVPAICYCDEDLCVRIPAHLPDQNIHARMHACIPGLQVTHNNHSCGAMHVVMIILAIDAASSMLTGHD